MAAKSTPPSPNIIVPYSVKLALIGKHSREYQGTGAKCSTIHSMNTDLLPLIIRFNDALNARDVDAMMSLQTADCVFENTDPAPAGSRYAGQSAVREFWEDFFRSSSEARIEIEEIFGQNDRAVMRWTYRWTDLSGHRGYIRGVDVYKVRDGLIAEKLSYVKG
jgi:ketosteroid isomerase-like protein